MNLTFYCYEYTPKNMMSELYVCVGDQLETWTVLKPSDGFKTGQTALKRAGRL